VRNHSDERTQHSIPDLLIHTCSFEVTGLRAEHDAAALQLHIVLQAEGYRQ
jgi:hypothetical protein